MHEINEFKENLLQSKWQRCYLFERNWAYGYYGIWRALLLKHNEERVVK